jgi:predicted DNA-binding protein (MmcQ/YjbR family)
MSQDAHHDRLLAITLKLPGAVEDWPWGSVHCKVNGKIFVGWGRDERGAMSVGFKTDKALQSMLVASDPRFSVAKYVGKHGWVDMRIGARPDWAEVEQFIVDSYRMIAPRKLVKQLDGRAAGSPAPPAAPRAGARRAPRSPSGPKGPRGTRRRAPARS